MRKDIFTDRWVIVADGDGLPLTDFHFKKFARDTGSCPFCEHNEAATPGEVFAIRNGTSSPNSPWQNHGKSASSDEVCGTGKMVASAGESRE